VVCLLVYPQLKSMDSYTYYVVCIFSCIELLASVLAIILTSILSILNMSICYRRIFSDLCNIGIFP